MSNLPAVANATDLKVAPVPSAGPAPAPTQLETQDLVVGTGVEAKATSSVKVQYVGANYADGKVFDSSWTRGSAATFSLNQVIPGFAQGIVGMKVGGRREIVIPSSLGYGAAGAPPAVAPNENLVFVVDLLGVQ
jgi:FKBP-type peptidyl-prolyl cis-trans isomerase